MSDLTNVDNNSLVVEGTSTDILAITDKLLLDVRKEEIPEDKAFKLPIEMLAKTYCFLKSK